MTILNKFASGVPIGPLPARFAYVVARQPILDAENEAKFNPEVVTQIEKEKHNESSIPHLV